MKKGELTYDLIVERSAELFNLYGYHRTALSDIMTATGLKKGGIYNHFSNKDEIAKAAFDRAYEKVIRRFRMRLNECKNASGKLFAIVEVFKSFYTEPVYKGGCPIYNTAIETTDAYPELKSKAIEAVNMLHSYIEIKIREGIESGEFQQDVVAADIATFVMTSLEGSMILSRVNGDPAYVERSCRLVTEYLNEKVLS